MFCSQCNEEPRPNRKTCARCAKRQAEAAQRYAQKKYENGICMNYKRFRLERSIHCADCLEIMRRRTQVQNSKRRKKEVN